MRRVKMKFTPRLSLPNKGNPYYNTKKYSGGYSPCIKGNNTLNGLDVLSNCVGWCVGRFNEIGGYGECRYLGDSMAYYMVTLARSQGLKVIQEPTVGGVMCWSGGSNGAGHVASVEAVMKNGMVVTSESEWYGLPFVSFIRSKGDGNWRNGCKWMDKSYIYHGCSVYNSSAGCDDNKLCKS